MEQNKNKNNLNNGPKMNMPKFNMNWIYIVVIGTLVAFWLTNENNSIQQMPNVESSYTDFQSYVDKGYASKLTVDKSQGIVKMYVKPEHVRDVFKQGVDKVGKDPYISIEIGSLDKLETFVEEKRAENKFTGKLTYEAQRNNSFISNLFWSVFPFLIIIGIVCCLWFCGG